MALGDRCLGEVPEAPPPSALCSARRCGLVCPLAALAARPKSLLDPWVRHDHPRGVGGGEVEGIWLRASCPAAMIGFVDEIRTSPTHAGLCTLSHGGVDVERVGEVQSPRTAGPLKDTGCCSW